MSRRFELSRLCLLVDGSIRPYTVSSLVSVTKEIEKDLLINLSEVLGQIKLWTHEFDALSDDDVLEKLVGTTNTVCPVGSVSPTQPTHCLSKIMSNLVSLLKIKSQYVQHMAGNVLLAISEFVAASVLMIRLSSHLKLDCSILVAWLHLINKYFQDLLLEPISQLEFGQDNCLEGSPFLLSVSNEEKKSLSPRHLQRLTIFLFLRCSFSLVSLSGRSKDQCLYVNSSSSMVSEQNWDPKCCRKKGLVELYEWLQKQVPMKLLESHELYSERCRSFTESFLQLYMYEDDLLFEVLLQLSMPLNSEQRSCKQINSQEVEDNMFFLVSVLFHPIQLFHVFLAEILYDHEMLLDYLISKDTGASSAEYLLRCLRTICDSWNFFRDFSFSEGMKQSPCKKIKGIDLLTHQQELFSIDVEGDGMPFLHEVECQKEHVYGSKRLRTSKQPFEAAKECLLSLKNSMENLHKRKLFPYNPEVLLRRLKRFQELCLKQ